MIRSRRAVAACLACAGTAFAILGVVLPARADQAAMQRADGLFAARKWPEALEVYTALTKINAADEPARRQAGACTVMLGESAPHDAEMAKFKAAETLLRACVASAPRDGAAHYWLARALGQEALFAGVWKSVSIGKEVKAQVDLALALDPTLDGAYHVRARWHREVTEKPKFARIPLGLGDASLDDGAKDIAKALELNPHHLNHHIEMARYEMRWKKPDDAREELTKALADPQMNDPEDRPAAAALLASLRPGK